MSSTLHEFHPDGIDILSEFLIPDLANIVLEYSEFDDHVVWKSNAKIFEKITLADEIMQYLPRLINIHIPNYIKLPVVRLPVQILTIASARELDFTLLPNLTDIYVRYGKECIPSHITIHNNQYLISPEFMSWLLRMDGSAVLRFAD